MNGSKKITDVPVISGDGLTLRPFYETDAGSLQKHMDDPRIARDVTNIPNPYLPKHARKWIEQTSLFVTQASKRVDFVIDIDGEVVGSIGFINLELRKAQVSYWLNPSYWGQGIVTKALDLLVRFGFETLELNRIFGFVLPENRRSAAVLKRAGFIFESTHASEWSKKMPDGTERVSDSDYYVIIRSQIRKDQICTFLITTAYGDGYDLAVETGGLIGQGLQAHGHVVDSVDQGIHYDLVVSVGGDGTVMKSLRTFSPRGIPTLGVNAGNVGFLTAAEATDYAVVVERIIAGDYIVERRMGLMCEWNGQTFGPLVNEVLLEHPDTQVQFSAKINDTTMWNHITARGVLLATTTGSTAQNTSAAGSIIVPDNTSMSVSMTPVMPARVSVKSLVLGHLGQGGEVVFTVDSIKYGKPIVMYGDGQKLSGARGILPGESVVITRHPHPIYLATFGLDQYAKALFEKKGFAQ